MAMAPRLLCSAVVHSQTGLTAGSLAVVVSLCLFIRFFKGACRPASLDDVGAVGHIQVSRWYAVPVYTDGTAGTRFSGRY